MSGWFQRKLSAAAWRLRCYWAAWNAGRATRVALQRGFPEKLLVVCYGNIYRSPYAAALLRKRLGNAVDVRSAGFHPVVGRKAPLEMIEKAASQGLDLASHRSDRVSVAEVAHADLVVVMDRHNWQAARRLGVADRNIVWLGTLDGGRELPDPYGKGPREIQRIIERLHDCTEALADQLGTHRESSSG